MGEMILADPDGDTLRIAQVYGLGLNMLSVRVTQDGEEASVNLTLETATQLRDYLAAFVE